MTDLLVELHKLAVRINSHGGVLSGDSMVERYRYFVEHSPDGENCAFARKCRDLFLTHDYEDILAQLRIVIELLPDIIEK